MRLMHLADLHLGKRFKEFSMLDEQEYILGELLKLAKEKTVDHVLIAGDVYDKPVPPAHAVELFDGFLYELLSIVSSVFVISGNHDSPERLAFGSRIMQKGGMYISQTYDAQVTPVTLRDSYGEVDVFMLPFIKPAAVRGLFPEVQIDSWSDALRAAVNRLPRSAERRSVLLAHQFITGSARSDSEDISVGGADNVDASVFDGFDYVALGHLHMAQQVTRPTMRYSGSPLKYSFSEVRGRKSVPIVDIKEKGTIDIELSELTPLHDMREIRGSYMELTDRNKYLGTAVEDYLHITLTDEQDVPEALAKLRVIYPNIMKLDYDNTRTRSAAALSELPKAEETSPEELFARLYELQNGQPMSGEQAALIADIIKRARGDDS